MTFYFYAGYNYRSTCTKTIIDVRERQTINVPSKKPLNFSARNFLHSPLPTIQIAHLAQLLPTSSIGVRAWQSRAAIDKSAATTFTSPGAKSLRRRCYTAHVARARFGHAARDIVTLLPSPSRRLIFSRGTTTPCFALTADRAFSRLSRLAMAADNVKQPPRSDDLTFFRGYHDPLRERRSRRRVCARWRRPSSLSSSSRAAERRRLDSTLVRLSVLFLTRLLASHHAAPVYHYLRTRVGRSSSGDGDARGIRKAFLRNRRG